MTRRVYASGFAARAGSTGRSRRVRPPAVAGSFYPADPRELRQAVEVALAGGPVPPAARTPKALVVPHAGYRYSGPVAASAYRQLAGAAREIQRVVLLGPSHRVPLRGIAVSGVDAFATPLGTVPIDTAGRDTVLAIPGVSVDDRAHVWEHSLEVQLPFLQVVLSGFRLLPLVVGDAATDEVATVLDAVWGGPETLVVVSTDLSHYHAYADAAALDRATAASVVARRYRAIRDGDACGARPLRGLLHASIARGLPVTLLDLRSSGDTAGDHDRVVGYGAFAVG
jgi:hypothetical protein